MATVNPAFIQELLAQQKNPTGVLESFARHSYSTEVLAKLNTFVSPAHPYSRHVIYSGPECEIMLARWTPQVVCAPHDHGQSEGWVFYLDGNFEETSFVWSDARLRPVSRDSHVAGSFTQVSDGEIHSCVSLAGGLSLHVYFPRIERMKVYDVEGERTFVVSDDCGAWLPENSQCLDEKKWHPPTAS